MLTIISFIVVLGVLVFIHEFGHYITAKLVGIRVEEFALGFGPKIISKKYGDTVYSIRGVPLGGFCQMTGEALSDDMSEEERAVYEEARKKGQAFDQKPAWQRFAVIFNGPLLNLVLAALIFTLIFALYGIAVESKDTNIIGDVIPGTPAAEAGLRPGDRIIEIDGHKIEKWEDLARMIHSSANKQLLIKYERKNQLFTTTVTPVIMEGRDDALIGILSQVVRERVSIFTALKLGFLQTISYIIAMFKAIGSMITGKMAVEIGGPVMIATMVGQASEIGFSSLLNLTAILSLNLGIFNLLPFPALDGGKLVFIIYEMIRRKPFPPEKENMVHVIGFTILIIFMILVIIKDISRFF